MYSKRKNKNAEGVNKTDDESMPMTSIRRQEEIPPEMSFRPTSTTTSNAPANPTAHLNTASSTSKEQSGQSSPPTTQPPAKTSSLHQMAPKTTPDQTTPPDLFLVPVTMHTPGSSSDHGLETENAAEELPAISKSVFHWLQSKSESSDNKMTQQSVAKASSSIESVEDTAISKNPLQTSANTPKAEYLRQRRTSQVLGTRGVIIEEKDLTSYRQLPQRPSSTEHELNDGESDEFFAKHSAEESQIENEISSSKQGSRVRIANSQGQGRYDIKGKTDSSTSIDTEKFGQPLQVRNALLRSRNRRASLESQRNFVTDQQRTDSNIHIIKERVEDVLAQVTEDNTAKETVANGSSITPASVATDISSTFKKYHLEDSIRKLREKNLQAKYFHQQKSEVYTILFRFCESRTFDIFIITVVLLNIVSVIIQTSGVVRVRAGWYLDFLDGIFLGIYIVEASLKIYIWRKHYFANSFNLMDFVILILHISDLFLLIVVNYGTHLEGATLFRAFRILRALRAARSLRVLRSIKVFANLTIIMNTCLRSMKSWSAILMLMLLFMYVFAVIGRGLFSKADPIRFSNLGTTFLVLAQLLSLDEWFYIYSDMLERSPEHWYIIIYVMIYILIEYFTFLSCFLAIFVDNFQIAIETNKEAIQAEKTVIVESNDKEEYLEINDDGNSDVTGNSETSDHPPRRTIQDVYPDDTDFTQDHLAHYFQLLTALEYNSFHLDCQKKCLDELANLCIETNAEVD